MWQSSKVFLWVEYSASALAKTSDMAVTSQNLTYYIFTAHSAQCLILITSSINYNHYGNQDTGKMTVNMGLPFPGDECTQLSWITLVR